MPTLSRLVLGLVLLGISGPLRALGQNAPATSASGHPIIALQGQVQHVQSREFELIDHYGNQILKTTIPSNGRFSFRARWGAAQPATLRIGRQTTGLWLTPGDNLTITLDARHFNETLRYAGRGSRANNFRAADLLASHRIYNAYRQTLAGTEKQFGAWLAQARQQAAVRCQRAFPHPTASETAFLSYQRDDMDFLRYKFYERSWNSDRLTRPGLPAPAIHARDWHGQPFSLASLRGKWVYVDFWASWCGFCRGESARARTLRAALADRADDVVFLNVSIDDSWDKWLCAVEADSLAGLHVLSPDSGRANVAATYLLASLPRYLLIGPDGYIIDGNAPRPSSGAVERLIRQSLAKPTATAPPPAK
ncbi:TlpA family protein disulfide reductase [Hymenobacter properus]|uniref:TlpA family protein disulfide reductase n=1 Tax=Hymenobacter properus TaxID=2791026 RepID=A0A931BIN5_9BACT|nr:TlpA disulfide reductase family protein [Hymenobacter properus]MBF9140898.1 TlpA family protein disulfide reductase [Hymenobacter properus]MBR7719707.1 TlpA family protein disulfide reductase [Microvirga sp. SRT04]